MQHGTAAGYQFYGCRCAQCVEANGADIARRRLRDLERSVRGPWWSRAADRIGQWWRCHVLARHDVKMSSNGRCVRCGQHAGKARKRALRRADRVEHYLDVAGLYACFGNLVVAGLWFFVPPTDFASGMACLAFSMAMLANWRVGRRRCKAK